MQDLERAKRARLLRAESYVHGSHPTPLGKYTADEVEQLGKEGKAMPKPGGGFWFPLVSVSDVANCVAAYRALKPSQRDGVREWITKRCRALKIENWLPQGWGGRDRPRDPDGDGDRAQSGVTEPARKCVRCAGTGRVGLGAICPRCCGVGRVRPFSAPGTAAPGRAGCSRRRLDRRRHRDLAWRGFVPSPAEKG
jgi:hypothetical protein